VLAALLDHNHHLIRDGEVLLADKSFARRGTPQGLFTHVAQRLACDSE
jgi:hypothetical protein